MTSFTRSCCEGFDRRCTCVDTSGCCDALCSVDSTVRLAPCSLLPENEAFRRRIMELEILLSRQGCQVPDEVKVLQAENCHFRDLTFARLAEVEYWKKMYAKERSGNEERLEALRREYQRKIEEELWRLKQDLEDNSRSNAEKDAIHQQYRYEIGKLKQKHQEEIANYVSPLGENILQKDLDGLREELETNNTNHIKQIQSLKDNLKEVMKTEIMKMTKDHALKMFNLDQENKALVELLNEERVQNAEQDKKKLEGVIKIIKAKEEEAKNLSRSAYQQHEADSALLAAYEQKKRENEKLLTYVHEMRAERDEMFAFLVKKLIEQKERNIDSVIDEFKIKFVNSPDKELQFQREFNKKSTDTRFNFTNTKLESARPEVEASVGRRSGNFLHPDDKPNDFKGSQLAGEFKKLLTAEEVVQSTEYFTKPKIDERRTNITPQVSNISSNLLRPETSASLLRSQVSDNLLRPETSENSLNPKRLETKKSAAQILKEYEDFKDS